MQRKLVDTEAGKRNFFTSAIAIPQLEGRTFATAYPQIFLECCSANLPIPNNNFFLQSATSTLQRFKEMLLCHSAYQQKSRTV
jgi:hypothetical protein